MKVTSAHFNPKIQPYLRHNDRTNQSSPNIHKDLMHLNEYTKSSSEVLREIDKLYDEAMQKLKGTKGKRTPKERSFHEAIFEIAEDTTMEQCQQLADEICKLTGFRTLQIAIHRDEGHTDLEGNFKTHYHAHAVFFTLDKDTGKQLARQEASLTKYNLSKIQDLASEIFQLQRGEKGSQKQYISDYREYKKIQKAKTEAEAQAKALFENVFDWKEQQEKEIQKQKEELAIKEQELAQKSIQIQEAIKNIDLQRKSILEQKEELEREKERLENFKQEVLGNAEETHEALRQEFKDKYSTFKNIITLGKHGKKLEEEYEKAENFLTTITNQAVKEADRRNKDIENKLKGANKLIISLQDEINNLILERRKEREAKENAHYKIEKLEKELQELRAKYEPQQEQVIQHTKTQSKNNYRSYGR